MKSSNAVKIAVSAAIFLLLILKIGLQPISEAFSRADYRILLLLIPVKIISMLLNALNIRIFLSCLGKRISYISLTIYTNLAWAIGLVLPGKLGELSLIYFLKKHDITYGESMSVAILDKIVTFFVLSVISVLGLLYYFSMLSALKFAVLFCLAIAITFFLLMNSRIRDFIRNHVLKGYSQLFKGFHRSMLLILRDHIKLSLNVFVTFIKWSFSFIAVMIIFYAFSETVQFRDVIFITAIAILAGLIPISIAGLGVREGAAVFLFSMAGISSGVTLAVFMVNTIANYVFGLLIAVTNLEKIRLVEI